MEISDIRLEESSFRCESAVGLLAHTLRNVLRAHDALDIDHLAAALIFVSLCPSVGLVVKSNAEHGQIITIVGRAAKSHERDNNMAIGRGSISSRRVMDQVLRHFKGASLTRLNDFGAGFRASNVCSTLTTSQSNILLSGGGCIGSAGGIC